MFTALILSLRERNSTLRMRVWRALRDAGCAVLRDGVYVLPSATDSAVFAQVEKEIRAAGGMAMTVELGLKGDAQLAHVKGLFDRGAHYGRLVKEAKAPGARLQRLQAAFERVAALDFFPGPAKRQAAEALAAFANEPQAARRRPRLADAARYRNRVWATRADPWVDRLASAWLIKRFIDRQARFAWIARSADRPRKAVGFDFDGAEFTHVRERVTFEVLLDSFGLARDPALAAIGAAVHFLDIGGIPVADARGLETVLRGIKEKARGDDALLAEAMRIFDLFHSAYGAPVSGSGK